MSHTGMGLVDQTRFGGPNHPIEEQGNCLAACVATLLSLPLDEVETYLDGVTAEALEARWWERFCSWLRARGMTALYLPWGDPSPEAYTYGRPGLAYIANGMGPRGLEHSVVYCDGKQFHDPHPSRAGLTAVTSYIVFLPLLLAGRPRGAPRIRTPAGRAEHPESARCRGER